MSDAAKGQQNGHGTVEQVDADQLILTYDRVHDHLEVGGACSSLDKMLDMLGRATRMLEAQWRMQQLVAMKQAQDDAALRQRIAQQHKH